MNTNLASSRTSAAGPLVLPAKRLLLALLLAGFGMGSVVAAETQKAAYVMAGVGQARAELRCDQVVRCDDRSSAAQVGAGYTLAPSLWGGTLVGEVRALDLGTVSLSNANLAASFDNHAVALGLAWWRPVAGAWSMGVGAGAAQTKTQVTLTPTNGVSSVQSQRLVSAYGLVAVNYALGGGTSWQATMLVTRVRYNQGGLDLGSSRAPMLTVGLSQAF